MNNIAEEVQGIFMDCLYTEEELAGLDKEKIPVVQGIRGMFGFNPERLEKFRTRIKSVLDEMPAEFQETGGGHSFLALCNDKNGVQWGEHRNMEQLCTLAIAAGLARWIIADPKMWEALPGGMPYIVFGDRFKNDKPV